MDLDSTLIDLGKALAVAKPHWPWFMYVAIFAFIGEVSKRRIYTPANIARMQREADRLWNLGKGGKFFALFPLLMVRIPFEFHPALAGFVLGLIPGVPVSEGVHYGAMSVIYCVTAGIVSLSFYKLLERVWEFVWTNIFRKDGPAPDLPLPGEGDSIPPAPTPTPTEDTK